MAGFSDIVKYCKRVSSKLLFDAEFLNFYRYNIEDVLLNKKSTNYPIFSLENYEIDYLDDDSGKSRKKVTTAIIIATQLPKTHDSDDIENIQSLCESVGDEFFLQLKEDSNTILHELIKSFSLNNLNGVSFSAPDNVHGMRWAFDLEMPLALNKNPKMWKDDINN